MHGPPLPLPKMITFQTKLSAQHVVNVTVLLVSAPVKKDTLDLHANALSAQTLVTVTEHVSLSPKLPMTFHTMLTMVLLLNFLLSQILIKIALTVLVPKILVLNMIVHGMLAADKDANVMLDTVDQTAL